MNVTLQFIRPFKPGRPDLSLRINEYTNTELFVNNATKQSKIPSQEKIELFDGPVLLPPEELVEACHAFIGSGDKSLPFDNVAYTDNGDAAVVLGPATRRMSAHLVRVLHSELAWCVAKRNAA